VIYRDLVHEHTPLGLIPLCPLSANVESCIGCGRAYLRAALTGHYCAHCDGGDE
jgi:hypothetical protein